jgi:hypothetical protein
MWGGGGAVKRWQKGANRALYMAEGREGGPYIWRGGGEEEGPLTGLEGPILGDREGGGPCISAWGRSGLYLSRLEGRVGPSTWAEGGGQEGPLPGQRRRMGAGGPSTWAEGEGGPSTSLGMSCCSVSWPACSRYLKIREEAR